MKCSPGGYVLRSAAALVGAVLIIGAGSARASTLNATSVTASAAGGLIYAGFDGAGFSVFTRDAATGELSVSAAAPASSSGGGLITPAIAPSPSGPGVYGVDGESDTLYRYEQGPGVLTLASSYPVLADTSQAKDPLSLLLAPEGNDVYVLTYGVQFGGGIGVTTHGKIVAFSRDPLTGELTQGAVTDLDPTSDGYVGYSPVISPDGRSIYVAGNFPGGLALVRREATTGAATLAGDAGNLNSADAVAVSPDGAFVYEAGVPGGSSTATTISVFSRNSSNGSLTPVSQVVDGVLGAREISDIWGLAISPDGHCLYATSRAEGSLAWFTRDGATGELAFGGAISGIGALANARAVTVVANNVYVASPGANGVAVFSRDPATCEPSFTALAQDLFTLQTPVIDRSGGTATLPVLVQTAGSVTTSVSAAGQQFALPAVAVSAPGTVDLPIAVSGAAGAELASTHKLSVQVGVTFAASGGTATTKSTTLELVQTTSGAARLSALRLSPASFTLTGRRMRGHCVPTTRRNRQKPACRRAVKITVSYSLSAPASVSATVVALKPGREVGASCRRPTRAIRRHRLCTLRVPERGTINLPGAAGVNAFRFDGRVGANALAAGRYVLVVSVSGGSRTDAAFTLSG